MKTLLTILTVFFTVMFSPPSYAEWTKVDENVNGASHYVDFERIKNVDGFVYWWDLTDYLKQTQYGHLSAKLHRQGDCKAFRYKFLRFYFYKEPMGGGVGQVEEPEEEDWQYPHPNSAQSVILKSVCNYVN